MALDPFRVSEAKSTGKNDDDIIALATRSSPGCHYYSTVGGVSEVHRLYDNV